MAEYLQRGESLDYTNATGDLIPAGTVVAIGDRIGVTGCPIPAGKTGSLHVVGVFEITKTKNAAIEMGKAVYFDGTGITTDTTGTSDGESVTYPSAGYAAAPAAASDTTILVKLGG